MPLCWRITKSNLIILSFIVTLLPPQRPTFCRALVAPSSSSSSSASSAAAASQKISTMASSSNINNNPPPTLPVSELVATATAYCSANGIQVAVAAAGRDHDVLQFTCAPISLLPNVFPASAFRQAQNAMPAFNVLVERLSQDRSYLTKVLRGVVQADAFTAQLWRLYMKIYGTSAYPHAAAADRLGIFRSDYMLHQDDNDASSKYVVKQVELNTIASSFGGLATRVAAMHRFLIARYRNAVTPFLAQCQRQVLAGSDSGGDQQQHDDDDDPGVLVNPALERIPAALRAAHDAYEQRTATHDTVVLFVVQDGERNTVDQRLLELELWQTHQVPVVRYSLTQLFEMATVDATTGALLVHGDEISVVYYRAGYAPTDYPDGDHGSQWQARERLECSRATKCPSLGYHLAGTKKMQQALARPGALERFFDNTDAAGSVADLRKSFAGLYSLGDDATAEDIGVVQSILNDHSRASQFVLKPQREGGGYNFYNERLLAKLQEHTAVKHDGTLHLGDELSEYILMERLFPPQQPAVLLRNGHIETGNTDGSGNDESSRATISELGCFGTILCRADGHVLHNEYAGFLLRTKFANVDEGGVASGFATLSSPYLVADA